MNKSHASFELCRHTDGREYLRYSIICGSKKEPVIFDNKSYVKIDVTGDIFKEITNGVGGFCANMTTRHISELKEQTGQDTASILLCCIPAATCAFQFYFVYLNKDGEILDKMVDTNYFDYSYFVDRFKKAVVEEGSVYDLEQNENLKEIAYRICPHPSLGFGVTVEGKEICYDDTFICEDFSIIREETREKLWELNARQMHLSFTCDYLHFIYLEGTITDDNEEVLKSYQVESGIRDINEYIKQQKEKRGENYSIANTDTEPFTFAVPLPSFAKMNHLVKRKEVKTSA